MTIAKRGDLAVIVTERRNYYIGRESTVRTIVEVMTVTSVTRDGVVKAIRSCWDDAAPQTVARLIGHPKVYVVSAADIDVYGAMAMARAHTWGGYPNQPRAFDSLDEAKEALRPFLLAA